MSVAKPPSDPARTVPLTTLRAGESGRFESTTLCCDDCELLNAMGLTDRCEIRVCRAARHSDARDASDQNHSDRASCIVQVNATRLGLSASLARHIYVTRA